LKITVLLLFALCLWQSFALPRSFDRLRLREKEKAQDYTTDITAFSTALGQYIALDNGYVPESFRGFTTYVDPGLNLAEPSEPQTRAGQLIIDYLYEKRTQIWQVAQNRAKITALATSAIAFATLGHSKTARVGKVPQVGAFAAAAATFAVVNDYPYTAVLNQNTFTGWYTVANNFKTQQNVDHVYALGNSPMWLVYYFRQQQTTTDVQTHYIPFSGNFGDIPTANNMVYHKATTGVGHAIDYQYQAPDGKVWMQRYLKSLSLSPKYFIDHPGILMELVLSGRGLLSFLAFMEEWADEMTANDNAVTAAAFAASVSLVLFHEDTTMVYDQDEIASHLPNGLCALNRAAVAAARLGVQGAVGLALYNQALAVYNDYMNSGPDNLAAIGAWFTAHHYPFVFHPFANAAENTLWGDMMKQQTYYIGFKLEPANWGLDDASIDSVVTHKFISKDAWKAAAVIDTW